MGQAIKTALRLLIGVVASPIVFLLSFGTCMLVLPSVMPGAGRLTWVLSWVAALIMVVQLWASIRFWLRPRQPPKSVKRCGRGVGRLSGYVARMLIRRKKVHALASWMARLAQIVEATPDSMRRGVSVPKLKAGYQATQAEFEAAAALGPQYGFVLSELIPNDKSYYFITTVEGEERRLRMKNGS
jgi:hypothetical protein